jgi:predicted  nucleic acid-binding Zn-ribbon protein
MDPKKKLEQLDGLVADLIIGQNRLVEEVSTLNGQVTALNEQVTTLKEEVMGIGQEITTMNGRMEHLVDFQRQSLEFQSRMAMQLGGIHDFMRQTAGDFQELKEDNKRLNHLETRVRTLETIVLKAS